MPEKGIQIQWLSQEKIDGNVITEHAQPNPWKKKKKSGLGLPSSPYRIGFAMRNLYAFLISCMRVTYFIHLILLDSSIPVALNESINYEAYDYLSTFLWDLCREYTVIVLLLRKRCLISHADFLHSKMSWHLFAQIISTVV